MSCNAARDEVHERLGNLGCGPFAVVTIPLRHPVDRTQQREYGELRIAGRDAAVLDAFPDQLAEAPLGLVAAPDERLRLVGKQRAVLEQHHRMPQLADEVLEVAAQRDAQLFQAVGAFLLAAIEVGEARIHRQIEGREKHLVLVRHVAVERRLGDTESLGDVVHRRAMEAGAAEAARSLAEDRIALELAALDAAGVTRRQLDSLTLGACDELDGRPISSMLMSAPAGGYGTDEIKVTDSGASALCLAYARFLAGESQLGLVASWCKSSKTDVEAVMRLRGDPFYTPPPGVRAAISHALFAPAVAQGVGVTEEEATRRGGGRVARAAEN